MRWRVLFTKIPGPVLYRINSCHKTSLEALCEAGGHELGVKSMRGRTGLETGRGSGCDGIRGKRESQTDRETHKETVQGDAIGECFSKRLYHWEF